MLKVKNLTTNSECELYSNAYLQSFNKDLPDFDKQSYYDEESFQKRLNAIAGEMESRNSLSTGLGHGLRKYIQGQNCEDTVDINFLPTNEQGFFQRIINWGSQKLFHVSNTGWNALTNRYYDAVLYLKGIDVEAAIVDQDHEILHNPAYSSVTRNAIRREMNVADEIQDHINKQYEFLYKKIKEAYEKAKCNEKPLMILIGENHISVHSAQIHSLVIHICQELFGLNTILTEPFHRKDYDEAWQDALIPLSVVDNLSDDFRIKLIPIDLALCSADEKVNYEGCESSNLQRLEIDFENVDISILNIQQLQYRNNVMAKVAINLNVNNTITIVGSDHLKGLIEETPLADHYEILAIHAAQALGCDYYQKDDWDLDLCLFRSTDPKVVQAEMLFQYSSLESRTHEFLIKQVKQRAEEAHKHAKFTLRPD